MKNFVINAKTFNFDTNMEMKESLGIEIIKIYNTNPKVLYLPHLIMPTKLAEIFMSSTSAGFSPFGTLAEQWEKANKPVYVETIFKGFAPNYQGLKMWANPNQPKGTMNLVFQDDNYSITIENYELVENRI